MCCWWWGLEALECPSFELHPSSWLPRENCQWGVPGHKKWSFSWGLDYFTWKNQASFLPANICHWDRTCSSPEWPCLPPSLPGPWNCDVWLLGINAVCSLPYCVHLLWPPHTALRERLSETCISRPFLPASNEPINLTAGVYTTLTFQGAQTNF